MNSNRHLWALVLAGGDDTRLQALTRLIAGAPIPVNRDHLHLARPQLAPLPASNVLVQPLVREVRPDDVRALELLATDADGVAAVYDRLRPWNFSRDFLAHVPRHLAVVLADDLGWSDWGTQESIERKPHAMGLVPPWRAIAATA